MSLSHQSSTSALSTTRSSAEHRADSLFRLAASLVRCFSRDKLICDWCFARRLQSHPEYDQALAIYLAQTSGKEGALLSLGHKVRQDGSIEVNEATVTPAPGAVLEVVPPRTDSRGRQVAPARYKIPCPECGAIDGLGGDSRSTGLLVESVEHLSEHLADLGMSGVYDRDAAIEWPKRAKQYDSLQGRDELVLATALYRGFQRALSA